jgi:TolB-like protein/Tfp pilus assembly protein PilF
MVVRFGEIELDLDRYELRRSDKLQAIEPKAFDLLVYLIENRSRVVSKDEIYEKIWDGRLISEATLTSCINAARTAIGDSGRRQQFIRTIPRRGYTFIADVTRIETNRPVSKPVASRIPEEAETGSEINTASGPTVHRPHASIVVLPFVDLGSSHENNTIADGITEDITTELARFKRLFVIARNSALALRAETNDVRKIAQGLGVTYALEGSVRRSGDQIRVTAQLIEAASGSHVWAERYDASMEQLFEVQDEITQAIVRQIEPEILAHERARFGRRTAENLDAWELVQKGLWTYYQQTHASHEEAITLFRKAVALDPLYSVAHAHLAFSLWTLVVFGRALEPKLALAEARQVVQHALSLDPGEPLSRFTAGGLCFNDGQIDFALEHMKAAIQSSPNYAGGHYGMGRVLYHGKADAENALAHFDFAIRLNPRNPMIWATYEKQCCAHRFLGQFDQAVLSGVRAVNLANEIYRPRVILAAALAAAGRIDDASAELQRTKELQPTLSTQLLKEHFSVVHPAVMKDLLGWLQEAGLE